MPMAPPRFKPVLIVPSAPAPSRGTTAERGYSYRWRVASQAFLKRYPLCVGCDPKEETPLDEQAQTEGIELLDLLQRNSKLMIHAAGCEGFARQTDHLVPISGPDDPKFFDETNFRPRSAECHTHKTNACDGGFGHQAQSSSISDQFGE